MYAYMIVIQSIGIFPRDSGLKDSFLLLPTRRGSFCVQKVPSRLSSILEQIPYQYLGEDISPCNPPLCQSGFGFVSADIAFFLGEGCNGCKS